MEKVADYVLLLFLLLAALTDHGKYIFGSLKDRKVHHHQFTECWTQPHFSSACSACWHQP